MTVKNSSVEHFETLSSFFVSFWCCYLNAETDKKSSFSVSFWLATAGGIDNLLGRLNALQFSTRIFWITAIQTNSWIWKSNPKCITFINFNYRLIAKDLKKK